MRKSLLLSTVGAVAITMAAPAMAEVDVFATIDMEKMVFVTENISKFKTVEIDVTDPLDALMTDEAAEAAALVNAENNGVFVSGSTGTGTGSNEVDFNVNLDASLTDSINGNTGVVGVNQDVGNSANQANLVALAYTAGTGTALADSQAEAEQANNGGSVVERGVREHIETVDGGTTTTGDPDFADDGKKITVIENPDGTITILDTAVKTATIENSITGNTGITGVNQNVGNASNQHNGVSLSVGIGAVAALSESALGQSNTGNSVDEVGTVRMASLTASVLNNAGITQVNQNTGNFNNQSSMVSFSAIGFGGIGGLTATGGSF
jgi:hypothetical protein